jgi:hypothetical protein
VGLADVSLAEAGLAEAGWEEAGMVEVGTADAGLAGRTSPSPAVRSRGGEVAPAAAGCAGTLWSCSLGEGRRLSDGAIQESLSWGHALLAVELAAAADAAELGRNLICGTSLNWTL